MRYEAVSPQKFRRVFLTEHPFNVANADWSKQSRWPAHWISLSTIPEGSFVAAYRLKLNIEKPTTIRLHITADERYEFFLDGERVAWGSERGDLAHWYFETYDVDFTAGPHCLVARVATQRDEAAFAQMSHRHGLMVCPDLETDGAQFATGIARWEAKRLGGYEFVVPSVAWGTGYNLVLRGEEFDWGFEAGNGEGWKLANLTEPALGPFANDNPPGPLLTPATLPDRLAQRRNIGRVVLVSDLGRAVTTHDLPIREQDQLASEADEWQALLNGQGTVMVPSHCRRRVIIDLEDYYCGFHEFLASGGKHGRIRSHWQESLYNEPNAKSKGNRDLTEGKYFVTVYLNEDGIGDLFLPDGGPRRHYEPLWWQAGRFIEIVVETGEDRMTLENFAVRETRYPLENEGHFECDDLRLAEVIPMMSRGLQMCAHETYMDCPYYEQLQYIGDTRLQVLVTHVMSRDDRLPRKALTMFNASRIIAGDTQSRYPTRVRQIIPPFSLWYVAMIHDHMLWRGGEDFIRPLMIGARGVLDRWRSYFNCDGLIEAPAGWNFMDWVPEWPGGIPPNGHIGVSSVINLQASLVFDLAAEIENWLDEPEMAQRQAKTASQLRETVQSRFWDESRGMIADTDAMTSFSEHAQILALLQSGLPEEYRSRIASNLISRSGLSKATIYFSHYLFEAYRKLGRTDLIIDRMSLWFGLKTDGLKTTIEMPEPTRSDCHAWGAHPLYHYYASILGIRPSSPGFEAVSIDPCFGPLKWAKGSLPHPQGMIEVDLSREGDEYHGAISLPSGLTGTFRGAQISGSVSV